MGQAVDYRITGWWRWKTVVVPPNVYVVHTRRGHAEPLHLGLGVSFRYDPATDAFLVIPAAVQTLLINARCISIERQGVLVQAYVQWVVDDLRTAYRKLDFSDPADPMRIVNVQLREQAEAAIKDKVATMPIDAILSDKQPIIEELTHRLRSVAESSGEGAGSTGLGLKIVTVQIKEAVVSSTRLWENLQKPFRAERERLARMAELEAQQQIARQELIIRQARETAELETARRLDELRAEQEREAYDRASAEKTRRHQVEQEAEQRALEREGRHGEGPATGRRGAGRAAARAGGGTHRPRAGGGAAGAGTGAGAGGVAAAAVGGDDRAREPGAPGAGGARGARRGSAAEAARGGERAVGGERQGATDRPVAGDRRGAAAPGGTAEHHGRTATGRRR